MQVDRAAVVRAIKDYTDALRDKSGGNAAGFILDEPEAARQALELACRQNGLSPEDYAAALAADPELAELEKESMIQAVAGLPDPGPYDVISRESPEGQPPDPRALAD
jgi:hypothetical protein